MADFHANVKSISMKITILDRITKDLEEEFIILYNLHFNLKKVVYY